MTIPITVTEAIGASTMPRGLCAWTVISFAARTTAVTEDIVIIVLVDPIPIAGSAADGRTLVC